jgi:periplasmic protein CpxP/Spy
MFSQSRLILALAIILSAAASGLAQQPQTPPAGDSAAPQNEMHRRGQFRKRMRHGKGARLPRLEGELALTEAQQQQLRAIHQRQVESIKAPREELMQLAEKRRSGTFSDADAAKAKELRDQLRLARQAAANEVSGILTAEQRERIQQLREERKAKRGERMRRRGERPEVQPQDN